MTYSNIGPVYKKYTNVVPFAWPVLSDAVTFAPASNNTDVYGSLQSIFAYSRGGVRFKFFDYVASVNSGVAQTTINNFDGAGAFSISTFAFESAADSAGSTSMSTVTNTPQAYANWGANQATEVMVPQYHRYHSRANAAHMVSTHVPYLLGVEDVTSRVFLSHTLIENTKTWGRFARSAADDANFGLLVSIPPMRVTGYAAQQ